MFSCLYRKQIANAKKAYSIDPAFAVSNSISFSKDLGRRLENFVYNKLRARGKQIFYYRNDKYECDFVVMEGGGVTELIQVCWDINGDNIDREIKGLQTAMVETKASKGTIVTFNQSDNLDGIELIPAWQWL